MIKQLQHIFNGLKDENEIAIIERYRCDAKYYTIKIIGKTYVNYYYKQITIAIKIH